MNRRISSEVRGQRSEVKGQVSRPENPEGSFCFDLEIRVFSPSSVAAVLRMDVFRSSKFPQIFATPQPFGLSRKYSVEKPRIDTDEHGCCAKHMPLFGSSEALFDD